MLAEAWQHTSVNPGGKYQDYPLFTGELLFKFAHHAALHVTVALKNEAMNLEAFETRRLDQVFAETKRLPDGQTLPGFVRAWKKGIALQCCKTDVHFESPSKDEASEVSIIFAADDWINPNGQLCTGSVLRAARDLIVLLIPGALDEFGLRLDFAPWETPESLLAPRE
jgi:hypothetical protein